MFVRSDESDREVCVELGVFTAKKLALSDEYGIISKPIVRIIRCDIKILKKLTESKFIAFNFSFHSRCKI